MKFLKKYLTKAKLDNSKDVLEQMQIVLESLIEIAKDTQEPHVHQDLAVIENNLAKVYKNWK